MIAVPRGSNARTLGLTNNVFDRVNFSLNNAGDTTLTTCARNKLFLACDLIWPVSGGEGWPARARLEGDGWVQSSAPPPAPRLALRRIGA